MNTVTVSPLGEEQKTAILNEHPGGIWIVLAEEYPPDHRLASDFTGGHPTFAANTRSCR